MPCIVEKVVFSEYIQTLADFGGKENYMKRPATKKMAKYWEEEEEQRER